MMQLKELETKAEEEEYMREEKDKMALEIYESWLVRRFIHDTHVNAVRNLLICVGLFHIVNCMTSYFCTK